MYVGNFFLLKNRTFSLSGAVSYFPSFFADKVDCFHRSGNKTKGTQNVVDKVFAYSLSLFERVTGKQERVAALTKLSFFLIFLPNRLLLKVGTTLSAYSPITRAINCKVRSWGEGR